MSTTGTAGGGDESTASRGGESAASGGGAEQRDAGWRDLGERTVACTALEAASHETLELAVPFCMSA